MASVGVARNRRALRSPRRLSANPARSRRRRASNCRLVATCSHVRSRTRWSASSRGASRWKPTSRAACQRSRSSGSSTVRSRKRSTASAAASRPRPFPGLRERARSTSPRRSCAKRGRASTSRSRSTAASGLSAGSWPWPRVREVRDRQAALRPGVRGGGGACGRRADPPPPPGRGRRLLTRGARARVAAERNGRGAGKSLPDLAVANRVLTPQRGSHPGSLPPSRRRMVTLSGRSTSHFSASSAWGVSSRFRLQIQTIPRYEHSFGTPQGRSRDPSPDDALAIVLAAQVDQDPNHRACRVDANASFSAASSRDGPTSRAVGAGPPRKLASTFPTIPRPNSM